LYSWRPGGNVYFRLADPVRLEVDLYAKVLVHVIKFSDQGFHLAPKILALQLLLTLRHISEYKIQKCNSRTVHRVDKRLATISNLMATIRPVELVQRLLEGQSKADVVRSFYMYCRRRLTLLYS